jgi:hypothetical protein
MTLFTLIAYKQNYCDHDGDGRTDSDIQIFTGLEEEELVNKYVLLETEEGDQYDFTVLSSIKDFPVKLWSQNNLTECTLLPEEYEEDFDLLETWFCKLKETIDSKVKEIKKEKKLAKEQADRQEKEKRARWQQEEELRTFKKLQAKYGEK